MTPTPTTPAECRDQVAWLAKITAGGTRVLATILVLALVFTMVNVQQFASQGHPFPSFHWFIAWLLDPMASLTMATAIVFEWVLANYGRKVAWLTATKWFAGLATLVMNTWSSFFGDQASPSGVVLHLVAPGLLLFLAEAAPRAHRHLTQVTTELVALAGQLETVPTEHVPVAAPTPAPVPVVVRQPTPAPLVTTPVPAGDLADLVTRAGELPAMGRDRLARELGCSPHQARLVLAELKSPTRSLTAA